MPHSQLEWDSYIRAVLNENRLARMAVDHVKGRLWDNAHSMEGSLSRGQIARVDRDLEGTYVVRVFAAFESALRSYERWWHPDRPRQEFPTAATMINEIGDHQEDNIARRRKREIGLQIRAQVREVRKTRNFWAHDDEDQTDSPLPIERVTERLLAYIRKMPLEWA